MDPNRDYYRYGFGAATGIFQAFVPTGAPGILAGIFILVLLGVVTGTFEGIVLMVAIVAMPVLALLIAGALKREMRREDRRTPHPQASSLPPDADLSDLERRDAMRRFDDDRPVR